jgi:aconitate hydratase
MIAKNGILAEMIRSGARIMESTCGFCIGNGQAPATGSVSARTSNRNFEGRSGTASAKVYLVSPQTAALAALSGKFVDPLILSEAQYPEISLPKKFEIDDAMILEPEESFDDVEIIRGPNIGKPPKNDKIQNKLEGKILIKAGDKITTDHIMPAGSRLKYRSNIEKYSEFVFEALDKDFYKKALKLKEQGQAGFVLAGFSYGQGSSREHAAMCPMYLGVKAVLAKSFERIHAANLINFGILPLVFVREDDYNKIDTDDSIEIKNVIDRLDKNEAIIVVNKTKNLEIPMTCNLSLRQKEIVKAGGLLNYTKGK